MGFLDILASMAASSAKRTNSTLDRIERKYGDRMNDEQRDKMSRKRSAANKLASWAESHQRGR